MCVNLSSQIQTQATRSSLLLLRTVPSYEFQGVIGEGHLGCLQFRAMQMKEAVSPWGTLMLRSCWLLALLLCPEPLRRGGRGGGGEVRINLLSPFFPVASQSLDRMLTRHFFSLSLCYSGSLNQRESQPSPEGSPRHAEGICPNWLVGFSQPWMYQEDQLVGHRQGLVHLNLVRVVGKGGRSRAVRRVVFKPCA